MEKIEFKNVLPQVFSQREELNSDVWKHDITFEKGHLYLIEADSGMGKSTFCSYVAGYRHDYSGSILFDKRNVGSFQVSDWVDVRQRHLGHLFQELRLFPELTALENVEIKNKLTGFKSREQILEWFDMLGLSDKLNAKIGRMSFGQQQRVAMIRALVQPFDFIIADEPISHLDDKNSRVMADIMLAEARRQGAAVIVTSIGKHMNLDYERVFRL
ncbi:ATP-binding cassette domain-containing protein [Prevotella sp. kh1p2]|uniref:ATP-binding cassette domain-containing protein n=1 Tax=Prevotella sp. kh1p2 TaxID=1761883 RepID=UPI0008CC35AD|nr:ATP-binding cassette domain-containing protein [Prevotella sp. kh1p2]SET24109.1 ABC-type lipoprotein export system, ATPase component [Prevotella sp. kh1p2]SNU12367.1 ABC-type lipoprotein export system, ATPase component [Prevotellaceae bacterium KH2P17]